MTVVGIDDTDSRTEGMCTTYLAAVLADRLVDRGYTVDRRVLVRLNPAIPHKTRGNAAVAVHTDADPDRIASLTTALIDRYAVTDEDHTAPGMVVAPGDPTAVPDRVASYAERAVTEQLSIETAVALANDAGYRTDQWGLGRGVVGALAAVGAWVTREDWTVEQIVYRTRHNRGTDRAVDTGSVFTAAAAGYPAAWDTVDRTSEEVVCVPNTPGPILYGIRGDTEAAVATVAAGIDAEPTERSAVFLTNQGTDDHLQAAPIGALDDGEAFRTTGTVRSAPETREGGHVFVTIGANGDQVPCVAFEPTKRFRDRVRALRPGDCITACGEMADGTLKLEKFAVRTLTRTERVTPTCPTCGRRMESAGADQGYRCRDCDRSAPRKVVRDIDRDLELGWYEVPPRARRHIAKPLVRGGFDGPIHPER